MTGAELRQKYLDFFAKRGHAIISSASILPENDPTTLFTSSGMQPLVPYLMGEAHPAGLRLSDSQKCLRSEDIDEVGDNRHNTFFEMLGNWSLGDYFKKEQLSWFFEFLTDELKLDPKRLYATVFSGSPEINVPRDDESVGVLKEIYKKHGIEARDVDLAEKDGMRGGRIFYYPDSKNWWSRSGKPADMPVGEIGGPDSEVFYDLGEDLKMHENSEFKNEPCHLNCDCGRFIEIGNSVFIEYIRTEKGFKPLKQKNVDFGGGFERLTMAAQGKDNIYKTDLYTNTLNRISQLAEGKEYGQNMREFEIIADHLKAATFIMCDPRGVVPSNTDQGYIVRRLIRRAIRYGRILGIERESWTKEVGKVIVHDYYRQFPELKENVDFVVEEFKKEELKFKKTLEKGLRQFSNVACLRSQECRMSNSKVMSGKDAFDLFQTYGFPLEITVELAGEKGMSVDEKGFQEEFKRHQKKSRTAAEGKFKGGLADHSEETTRLHTASHLLLESLRRVLGDHVHQKGSNISSERLRFDFSHTEKMTGEQKQELEKLVNKAIKDNLAVSFKEMSVDEAKKAGAEGVFDTKYGDKVKVYRMGDFSTEICGGPHVENTGGLGKFVIKKEQSSSAGVRRIKATLE